MKQRYRQSPGTVCAKNQHKNRDKNQPCHSMAKKEGSKQATLLREPEQAANRAPLWRAGYAEHVHSASCYSGDDLVCGMTEHVHTDACYQESPASMDMDDLDIEADGPIIDDTIENTDLSLALDDLDLLMEDVAAEPASNAVETGAYSLSTGAMVSQIIEAVGLGISLAEIKEVGAALLLLALALLLRRRSEY